MERGVVGVNIAILAVSDKPTVVDEPSAKLLIDRLGEVGHRIVAREVIRDNEQAIRAQLLAWIADPNVDVVIAATAIESDSATDALEPLVTKSLRGFSDLFRLLSYQEIGTAAMLVDAEAAQCGSTYVFLLPASLGAVRTALDKLLIPQLDVRTKPRNLASRIKKQSDPVPLTPPSKLAVATPPAGLPIVRPASASTPPAGLPTVRASSTSTPPADPPTAVPQTMPLPLIVVKPASATTPAAGLPVVRPASAATPPMGTPLPPITPQKPAVPTTITSEKTNVGPPPPPPPPRPTGLPPLPPGAGQTHPTGSIPLLPLSLKELAESAPPVRSSRPTPPPPPVVVAEPPPPAPEPAKPAPTKPKASTMIDDLPAITTGTVSTIGDLPVFSGDAFAAPRPRRKKRGVLIWLGLALVSAAGTILFVTYRDHDQQAVAGNRSDHLTGSKPAAPVEIKPPAIPAKAPEPQPETTPGIVVEPTPPPPANDKPTKIAVEPTPTPPPAANDKPAKIAAKRTAPPATPRHPTEHVATSPPPPTPAEPPVERPAKVTEPPSAPVAEGCDEVSCVLDHYDRPCCERFKPVAKTFAPQNGVSQSLQRPMVIAAMDKLKPLVIRCGETHPATGTVKLAIEVDSNGHVTEVSVSSTPDAGLGDCVAAAIRKARFPKTENGGSFNYPFVF